MNSDRSVVPESGIQVFFFQVPDEQPGDLKMNLLLTDAE